MADITLYGSYVLAYLIGSIPFGLILTKLVLKQDITKIGSGNIGATNVLRTGNKKLALATLILDALKGVAAIFIIYALLPQPDHYFTFALTVGLFAILGHCFPVWLKFKGGKGVATTLGVLLIAVPFTGALACMTWLLSAFTAKISSLAAISAMILAPAFTYFFHGMDAALINVLISLLVIYRHKENIKRMKAGTEPRIGGKKKDA